jgi:hypothetical protein
MILFRRIIAKPAPSICQCKHCGNPQADLNEKCFYCRQFQPTEPILAIDDAIDLETLHGVKKERPMSYVDVPSNLLRGIDKYFDLCKEHQQIGMITRHQMARANLEPKLLPMYVREV